MLKGIIEGLLVVIALVTLGALSGYHYRDAQVARELAEAQQDAIERANVTGELSKALAVSQTESALKQEARVREAKLRSDLDAAQNNRSECVRGNESLRVLLELIDSGNGEATTTNSVSKGVRVDPQAGRWFGSINSVMGERVGGALLGVP